MRDPGNAGFRSCTAHGEEDIGSLPILDGELLAGVVTDRDIVIRAITERERPARYAGARGCRAMSSSPFTRTTTFRMLSG